MFKKATSLFCLLIFLFPFGILAAAPVGGYQPGATLNPDCTPGSANCTVVPLASSGANLNISSLGGLTTPLSFSQGGTGLSSLGAGELLYSSAANSLSPLALNADFLINSGTLNVNDSNLSFSASQLSDFNTSADGRITLQKAVANGLATLDANGKVPTDQLNPIELNNTFVVTNSSDLSALLAAVGDIAVVTGENKTYVLKELPASSLANWVELLTPASVLSVNSHTGVVTLSTSDIGEGSNLYFTNERSDDRVGALINDGIGIYKTYDDVNNTLTLNINESLLNVNNLGGFPLSAAKGGTGLGSNFMVQQVIVQRLKR